jgi:arginine decarboxylase
MTMTSTVPGPAVSRLADTHQQKENQVATPPVQAPTRTGVDAGRVLTRHTGPRIRITRSCGAGATRLAAFDAALVAAGLQDFNLVPLSSVVPLGATLEVVGPDKQLRGRHGDLLYCVYAAAYATIPGAEAWAGIAWGLRTDGSGAGLFVEHSAPTEAGVHAELSATLGAMMDNRREEYVEGGRLVSSATCTDAPVSALVVASFQTAGWSAAAPAGQAR